MKLRGIIFIGFLLSTTNLLAKNIEDTIVSKKDSCRTLVIGNFKGGKKNGEWKFVIRCENVTNDSIVKEEVWRNGQILFRKQVIALNSFEEVKFFRYGKDSIKKLSRNYNGIVRLTERYFRMRKEIKHVMTFYPNGKIKDSGKKKGRVKWVGEIGKRFVFEKQGKWKFYNKEGALWKRVKFKNGEAYSTKYI